MTGEGKRGLGEYWFGEKGGQKTFNPGLAWEASRIDVDNYGDGNHVMGPFSWPFILPKIRKVTNFTLPYYAWGNFANALRIGFYSDKNLKPYKRIGQGGPYQIWSGGHSLDESIGPIYLPANKIIWAVIMTDDPTQDIIIGIHSLSSFPENLLGMTTPMMGYSQTAYITYFATFELPELWPSAGYYSNRGQPFLKLYG